MSERDSTSSYPACRRFLCLFIGFLGIALSFGFWHALSLEERAHVRNMTRVGATTVQADFHADITTRIQGLVRLAGMWTLSGPPSQKDWEASAKLYLIHNPSCVRIELLDPDSGVRSDMPFEIHRPGQAPHVEQDQALRQSFKLAQQRKDVQLSSYVPNRGGQRERLLIVPIYAADQLQGFVAATFSVAGILEDMLDDIRDIGYSVAIADEFQEVHRLRGVNPENEGEWATTAPVSFAGVTWSVKVWPKPEMLAEMNSILPEVALGGGILFTLVLTLAVFLAQQSEANSRQLKASQARFAGILEISADAIVSVNGAGEICLFNQGAEKIFGYAAGEVLGQKLDILLPAHSRKAHRAHVATFGAGPRATMKMDERRPVVGLRKDGTEFPLEASISKLVINGEQIFTTILRDISERVRAEDELRQSHELLEQRVQERTAELARSNASLRELSGRMLASQDDERRRIARELHDSSGQTLAAVNMNLSAIQGLLFGGDARPNKLLSETIDLVRQISREIRTISYLLHPPVLDDLGLADALRWYAQGFSNRSGIKVSLELEPEIERLPSPHELALFRVVQEALTNIHRHAQSRSATIRLFAEDHCITLEVADQGRGMPLEVLKGGSGLSVVPGVGIAGMQERIRQLGGCLGISSDQDGTTVVASLPLPADAACPDSGLAKRTVA